MREVMIHRPRRQGATVRTTAWRAFAAGVGLAQILQDDVPMLSGADADRELQAFVQFAFSCEAATAAELLQHIEEQRVRIVVWRNAGRPVHQPRHWLRYAEGALARRFGARATTWEATYG